MDIDYFIWKFFLEFKKIVERKMSESKHIRLFVSDFPFTFNEEHLMNIFGKYGTILECLVNKMNDGRSKGNGFIKFDNEINGLKAMFVCFFLLFKWHCKVY